MEKVEHADIPRISINERIIKKDYGIERVIKIIDKICRDSIKDIIPDMWNAFIKSIEFDQREWRHLTVITEIYVLVKETVTKYDAEADPYFVKFDFEFVDPEQIGANNEKIS